MKRLFQQEIQPHIDRIHEKRRKRGLRNTLYDPQKARLCMYKQGSNILMILIKSGISYARACDMLGR